MGGSELQEAPSKEALTNINGQEKVEVRHSMIIGDEIWIMCEGETAHLKKINSCISLALSGSSSGGVHESDDLDDIYDIQNGCCYFTGKPILSGKSDALIFHLKPLDCGGDHWPGNIIYVSKEIPITHKPQPFSRSDKALVVYATQQRAIAQSFLED